MKLAIAIGVASVAAQSDDLWSEFQDWQVKHNKTYASNGESSQRFVTWKSNRDFVNSHNARADAGQHSFRVALNKFGDMTNDEYRSTYLGFRSKQRGVVSKGAAAPHKASPDSWDWRPKGVVNAIKDQAQCGSCWAFSAVAAMEFAVNYKNGGTVPSQCQGNACGPNKTPCCSFSEQELVDCVNNGKDTCKVGGEMSDGVDEIVKQMKGVIDTETQYPYTSGGGQSPGVCKAKSGGVDTGITGWTKVTEGDESALKDAAAEAVVSIGIDASQLTFQFYESGIYDEARCKNKLEELDHGVAIVGYGSGTPPSPGPSPGPSPSPGPPPGPSDCSTNHYKPACLGESGCSWCTDKYIGWCQSEACSSATVSSGETQEYWIVRNSWGESWGNNGYIFMSRNKNNQCGVASDAITVQTSSDRVLV